MFRIGKYNLILLTDQNFVVKIHFLKRTHHVPIVKFQLQHFFLIS